MNGRVKAALGLVTAGIVLLAGCAAEGEYVGPSPAYVEPYPYYDPFYYGPDVYVAPGYGYRRHYHDHAFNQYPRYPRQFGSPNAHTIPVPSVPSPRPSPPSVGRPAGGSHGGGGAHNIPPTRSRRW